MKPGEVGIIVVVIAILGYFWYQHHSSNAPASPGSQSPGLVRFVSATVPPCGSGVNPTNAATPIYGPTLQQAGYIKTCCGEYI